MRAILTALDQGVSALSNTLLLFIVARTSNVSELGVISAGLFGIAVAVAISRSSLGSSVALSASEGPLGVRGVTRKTLGLLLLLAPATSLATGVGVAVVSQDRFQAAQTLLLALAAPVVLMQDNLRFAASALARPIFALGSDCIWLLLVVMVWRGLGTKSSATSLVLSWMLGAMLALGVIFILVKVLPARPKDARRWFSENRHYLLNSAASPAALYLMSWLRTVAIGAIGGPELLGQLAAGLLLTSPANVLHALLLFGVMPYLAARRLGSSTLARTYLLLGCIAGSGALIWGFALNAVPTGVGERILGVGWQAGLPLVWPMTALTIASILFASASATLLALRRPKLLLLTSAIVGVCNLVVAVMLVVAESTSVVVASAEALIVGLGALGAWLVVVHITSDET